MKISIITTFYNRPEHFRLFLDALQTQTRRPDEIVVADDGSDPDCAAEMARLAAACEIPVKIVRQNHDGYRVSAARNLAIRAATGEYLVFADCDIAFMPDTIAVHERHAAPRRILAGHRAILPEEATRTLMAIKPAPTEADWNNAWTQADPQEAQAAQILHARHARLRRWHVARPHKPKILGCHFSLFLDDVRRVNGFDENYVGWGYEDDDFARRLYIAGVKPYSVIEEAAALHLWHPSLAPQTQARHRDRPNRSYFRRRFIPAYCPNGLKKT